MRVCLAWSCDGALVKIESVLAAVVVAYASGCNCGSTMTTDAGQTGGGSAGSAGGSAATGGGSAVSGGGSAVAGGGSAVTGGGSAASGGGGAVVDAGPGDAGLTDAGAGDAGLTDAGTPPVDGGIGPYVGTCQLTMTEPVKMFGPLPYLETLNSRFPCEGATVFALYDFENNDPLTPGATNNGTLSSSFGPGLIDSVDGDDGVIDGICSPRDGGTNCNALWGGGSVTFTFTSTDGGPLPRFFGAVWTDGEGEVFFEAFDVDGGLLGRVGPVSEAGVFPDNTVQSSTSEDRFFGVVSNQDLGSVRIGNTAGGVEVDHVQFGR